MIRAASMAGRAQGPVGRRASRPGSSPQPVGSHDGSFLRQASKETDAAPPLHARPLPSQIRRRERHAARREPPNGHRRESSPKPSGSRRTCTGPTTSARARTRRRTRSSSASSRARLHRSSSGSSTPARCPTNDRELGILYNFIAFQFVRTPSARRLVAGPREQAARIIIDLLENDRTLYESEMRRSGGDLNEFPFERIQRRKGMYEPRLTTEGSSKAQW